jgi:hypothetical protein
MLGGISEGIGIGNSAAFTAGEMETTVSEEREGIEIESGLPDSKGSRAIIEVGTCRMLLFLRMHFHESLSAFKLLIFLLLSRRLQHSARWLLLLKYY